MPTVSLAVSENRISEGLPVEFEVRVGNSAGVAVDLNPYDALWLPDCVLKIKFTGSQLRTPPPARVMDFGVPAFRLAPGQSRTLKGYLQEFLTRLPAGQYSIPYSLDWPGDSAASSGVRAAGTLSFLITRPDRSEIGNYISQRLKAVRESDAAGARAAAYELSLVQDPEVAMAAETLIRSNFVEEGLRIAARFDSAASTQALKGTLNGSVNPVLVREAADVLRSRGATIGPPEIGSLLASRNTATQTIGLHLVGSASDPAVQARVEELLQSTNAEVRQAARSAYDQFHNENKPR